MTEVTPPTVARSVRMTLERLGAAVRGARPGLAVLGDDVEVDLAGAWPGLRTMEAASRSGELNARRAPRDATPLRFRHPLVAGGARATLTAPERAVWHARAANSSASAGAGPERVALQLMHTAPGGDPQVVADLRAAARIQAVARGGPAIAAAL